MLWACCWCCICGCLDYNNRSRADWITSPELLSSSLSVPRSFLYQSMSSPEWKWTSGGSRSPSGRAKDQCWNSCSTGNWQASCRKKMLASCLPANHSYIMDACWLSEPHFISMFHIRLVSQLQKCHVVNILKQFVWFRQQNYLARVTKKSLGSTSYPNVTTVTTATT